MKYVAKQTIVGKTGRAQLTLRGETFSVRLLPKGAHRSTSFAAGDPAYVGPDLDKALLHVRAWTGVDTIELLDAMLPGSDPASLPVQVQ